MEFDESKHPRDKDGKFTDRGGGASNRGGKSDEEKQREAVRKFSSQPDKDMAAMGLNEKQNDTIKLPDEVMPKSVGAKWANYDIRMPNGGTTRFVEGSKLQNIEVFAGKGTKTPFRQEDLYIKCFGGKKGEWQKVKGFGMVYDEYGEERKAELHWCQAEGVGRVDFKIKKRGEKLWLD